MKNNPDGPIRLSRDRALEWHGRDRISDDLCEVTKREQESTYPGCYQVTGYDPCKQTPSDYCQVLSTLMTNQKQYYNPLNYADADTRLTHPPLTNMKTIHQLFTRPYVGSYQGPGNRSTDPCLTDTESFLLQGFATSQFKPCEGTSGKDITSYGMNYLPCFGNPQRVEHVIEPPTALGGWVRGGEHTRDFVRRVEHRKKCLGLHQGASGSPKPSSF